ncbi:MAG: hypothetical protein ABI855_14245, partial [Bacteroidota bacterium]
MNKLFCLIVLFVAYGVCEGQNLVPNPSFEDTIHCPIGINALNDAVGWFKPTLGTPDLFNICNLNIPHNFFGYQVPRTGVAYAGIITLITTYDSVYNSWREYAEVKLNSSLQTGTKYFISFYVSLADSVNYATDDIGAYLSIDTAKSDTSYLLAVTPQIENLQGNYLTDKTEWIKIAGSFIAQGNERFLTIGNFKNYHNTDTL